MLIAEPSRGEEAKLAVSGNDPIACLTKGKPVHGQSEFERRGHNSRWRFTSAAHRNAFSSNPDCFAPQYNGYCAIGVTGVNIAAPHKDTVDPEVWTIIECTSQLSAA